MCECSDVDVRIGGDCLVLYVDFLDPFRHNPVLVGFVYMDVELGLPDTWVPRGGHRKAKRRTKEDVSIVSFESFWIELKSCTGLQIIPNPTHSLTV